MTVISSLKHQYRYLRTLKHEMRDRHTAGRGVTVLPDDVWLVSYPKSGNTWTRFLLANLLNKDISVDFSNIEKLVPDIYQHSNLHLLSTTSPRVLKSHEYFDPRYKKVILIVRDPRDVVVSYYHHKIKTGIITEKHSMTEFVDSFIHAKEDEFGSWGENVGSWLGARSEGRGILILRYEDMLSDTVSSLQKITSFLSVASSTDELNSIYLKCEVGEMQKLEKEQSHLWKPMAGTRDDKLFVRKGVSNAWEDELSDSLSQRIVDAWSKQMKLLGYI